MRNEKGGLILFLMMLFWALFVGVLKRSYFAAAALVSFQVCQFADGGFQGEIRKKEKSWLKTFSDEIETLLIYKNRRIPGRVAIFVKILNPGSDFDYNREKWFGSSFGDSEHVARK